MDAHSKTFSPSGSHVWTACGQSSRCAMRAPTPIEGEAAKRGTGLHEAVEKIMRSYLPESTGVLTPKDMVGTACTNGYTVQPADAEPMGVYVIQCLNLAQRFGGLRAMSLEKRVQASILHPDCWGTLDFSYFDESTRTVYLKDAKFGHHPVEVVGNTQMLIYAIAEATLHPTAETFVLEIVQPSARHPDGTIRSWSITREQLQPWIEWFKQRITNALDPNAPFVTGPHCGQCDGILACPKFNEAVANAIYVSGQGLPFDLDPQHMAPMLTLIRHAQEALESMADALEPQMVGLINKGTHIKGWAMRSGKGNRRWKDPAMLSALASMAGEGISLTEEKPVTPAEAERRGVPTDIVNLFTETPDTAPKLVPDDNTHARKVFKNG